MVKSNYQKYLETLHWKRTRLQRLLRCHFFDLHQAVKCERCGMFVPILPVAFADVHHLTYERIGAELMEDLQVLCRSCHGEAHGHPEMNWHRVARETGLTLATSHFIRYHSTIKTLAEVVYSCGDAEEICRRWLERNPAGYFVEAV